MTMDEYNRNKENILKEVKESYDNFLNDIVKLVKHYNCNSAQEILSLAYILNKYYARGREQSYNCNELEKFYISGLTAILKGGVCRHKAALLSDIYKKLNMDSVLLAGEVGEGYSCRYDRRNRKLIYYADVDYRRITNHIITMVADDNKRYFVDPTNFLSFYMKNKKLILLGNRSGYYFGYSEMNLDDERIKPEDFKENRETYQRIFALKDSRESDDLIIAKEKFETIKKDKETIKDFVRSQRDQIKDTNEKCYVLGRYYR